MSESVEQILGGQTAPETEVKTTNQPEAPQEEPKQEEKPPQEEDNSIDKKFENLKSRLKAEKREMRNQFTQREQQLLAELENYKKLAQPQKTNGEPTEDDKNPDGSPKYRTYDELMRARMDWQLDQRFTQNQQQQQQAQATQQEQQWVKQRETEVDRQTEEFLEEYPQYAEVLEDNAEIIQYFTPEIGRAFLQAENAPLAFVTLAQEGKLESLLRMSPAQAAMAIAKAEIRGEALLKKPVTNAPPPLSPNRGSAPVGPKPENMSGDDILKAVRASRG